MLSQTDTPRPSSGARRPRGDREEGPGGLEDRFFQFSELCAAFSRMVLSLEGARSDLDRRREVQRNLAIARGVFSKWGVETLVVLYTHMEGLGFEALRRAIGGISPRVLSLKLRRLEALGLVRREVISTRPPRVNYTLSTRGRALARMAEPLFLYLDRYSDGLSPTEERAPPSRAKAQAARPSWAPIEDPTRGERETEGD